MKYFYVTGSSRGLGRALTERLLEDDENFVIGIARGDGPRHEQYHHVHLDLADVPAVCAFEFEPRPDATRIVLVNNAAMMAVAHYGEWSPETIVKALSVNTIAPALLTNAFVAAYGETDADLLVCNLSSGAAERAVDGGMVYCGSKASLNQMTRVGVEEFASAGKKNLTFLAIAPGSVDTEMQTYLRNLDPGTYSLASAFQRRYDEGHVRPVGEVAERLYKVLMNPAIAPGTVFNLADLPD